MLRRATLIGCAAALLTLAGCANLRGVTSDVTSYSYWPADRKPTSYAYERLPSQQAQPAQQDELEQAARRSLEDAGFVAAASPASADVNVQLGNRIGQYDRIGTYDRFGPYGGGYAGGFGGGFGGFGGYGPGRWGPGAGLGMRFDTPYYEREVSILIRDRKSGQSLYESRARSDGTSAGSPEILEAMFQAALKDFPQPAVNPRRVLIDNSRQ